MTTPLRAAGGVVWQSSEGGELRVLLVHRPRYDDWTFPKGKAKARESDLECALREVEEETGLRCAAERELPSTSYADRHGRPKLVRYWAMRPLSGTFRAHREVDEVRWLSVDDAAEALTYGRDRAVLTSLAEAAATP